MSQPDRYKGFAELLFLALMIVALLTMFGAIALHVIIERINSEGNIITYDVEVFEDKDLTIKLTAIDWGDFVITGDSTQTVRVVYVTNDGNQNLTLRIETDTWSPNNTWPHIVFETNYTDTDRVIKPDEVVSLGMTLTVHKEINTVRPRLYRFTFDIIFVGESIDESDG